jgi:prophage antirepressor-like protein
MDELQIFTNEEFGQVRTVLINNEPYFIGKDISEMLGYSETNALTKRLDEDEFISDKLEGMNMKSILINESGLYNAILGSKMPNAKKFKKWVTNDVLPSIRKHGMYAIDELLDNPDLLIKAATQLKEERKARLEAENQRNKLIHQGKLYTTGEIAKELNLSSATKLNNLLAEKKIQFKQNGTWLLYSKYSEMDLISIKQQQLDNGKVIYDRKWNGTGRDFILDLFKNKSY